MQDTVTIRIPTTVHARRRRLAADDGRPLVETVDSALDRDEQERRLAEYAADVARLRTDPEDFAAFDAENALWDASLADGLEGEPDPEPQHP